MSRPRQQPRAGPTGERLRSPRRLGAGGGGQALADSPRAVRRPCKGGQGPGARRRRRDGGPAASARRVAPASPCAPGPAGRPGPPQARAARQAGAEVARTSARPAPPAAAGSGGLTPAAIVRGGLPFVFAPAAPSRHGSPRHGPSRPWRRPAGARARGRSLPAAAPAAGPATGLPPRRRAGQGWAVPGRFGPSRAQAKPSGPTRWRRCALVGPRPCKASAGLPSAPAGPSAAVVHSLGARRHGGDEPLRGLHALLPDTTLFIRKPSNALLVPGTPPWTSAASPQAPPSSTPILSLEEALESVLGETYEGTSQLQCCGSK